MKANAIVMKSSNGEVKLFYDDFFISNLTQFLKCWIVDDGYAVLFDNRAWIIIDTDFGNTFLVCKW